MKTVIDLETSYQLRNGKTSPIPYDPKNKIVTIQYCSFKEEDRCHIGIEVINHKDYTSKGTEKENIQQVLDKSELLIGHNIKFDYIWLKECGFNISCPLYDTMVCEYINAKGMKIPLNLKDSALRHGITPKGDYVAELIANGIPIEESDLEKLKEYALNDVQTTWELYLAQQKLLNPYNAPVIKFMNEFIEVIGDIERKGIAIDYNTLLQIENDYRIEYNTLKTSLQKSVQDVVGDKIVNLASNEQLSQVIYSRKVTNRDRWANIFNIGAVQRNSVFKKGRPPRMSESTFKRHVIDNTVKVYKTEGSKCTVCNGFGAFRKKKKDGTDFKKDTSCKNCFGEGVYYSSTSKVSGFKVTPLDNSYVSDGGFSVSKLTLTGILGRQDVKDEVKAFIKDYLRHSAISTYLTTFIDGIRNNLFDDNTILHTNFNQCVTATGRLSSSNPNFHNLPRDKTFPIRRVIKSRFSGGKILDADLAQIEFRVAAILGNDEQAKEDILNGIDVHNYTAKVLTDAGQTTDRQTAKSHTFKPLYGGLSGTNAEQAYYKTFLENYRGIDAWQRQLSELAISEREIKNPSGRIYSFPDVTRRRDGKASQYTQIVNYCVQGFAGDITQCIMIDIYKAIKEQKLKSLLILTVHDSITADVHPDEIDVMIQVFKKALDNVSEMVYNRFSLKLDIPIGYDLNIGDNWANKQKVK